MPIERFVSRKNLRPFQQTRNAGRDEGRGEPDTGHYGFPSLCPNRYDAHVFKQDEYEPGTSVPITGRYESCHVFGRRTGVIVELPLGRVLPAGPRGWFWSLVTVEDSLKNGTSRWTASLTRPSLRWPIKPPPDHRQLASPTPDTRWPYRYPACWRFRGPDALRLQSGYLSSLSPGGLIRFGS
jgi:hypothetical protein